MANIYEVSHCVSENDIGKQMKVSGWVENIRDHGGVSFIIYKRYVQCTGSYPD